MTVAVRASIVSQVFLLVCNVEIVNVFLLHIWQGQVHNKLTKNHHHHLRLLIHSFSISCTYVE